MKTQCSTKPLHTAQRIALPALLTAMLLLISACASTPPPTEQVAVSTSAVASATSAGGSDVAPVEMQMARQKLDRAKVAMTAKDYPLARSLSEEAQVDAQLAEAKAHSTQASKAAYELRESVRVLREELDRQTK